MVNYTYNAWGVVSSSVNSSLSGDLLTAANGLLVHNPYVYKGYYYDSDTGYYYLKSRYYDPRIHRFLSADKIDYLDPKSLSSLNLYVYCGDNPVMGYDPSGKWDWGNFWKILGTIAIVGSLVALTIATGGAAAGTFLAFANGLASSALMGAGFGAVFGAVVGGLTGGWQGAIDGMFSGSWQGAITGAVSGGLSQLQFGMKTYHAGKFLFNFVSQPLLQGTASLITSAIKGSSYEEAMTAYAFAVIGGFFGVKENYLTRKLIQEGLIQFGLQFGEFGVNWMNGEYNYAR